MDVNLCKLKEMLLDERKLITYISVSRDLCIHVNESKYLLRVVVDEIKKNYDKTLLNVSHIISGLFEDNQAHTIICTESELVELKPKFKNVFFHHIYSLSVGAPSSDNVLLLAVNKFEDFPLCRGLIKSKLCAKRGSEEIISLKTGCQEVASTEKKTYPHIDLNVHKKIKVENKGEINAKTATSDTKVFPVKIEPKTEISPPKKHLAAGTVEKNVRKNINGNKSQKGIAGFFNRNGSATVKKINQTKSDEEKMTVEPDKEAHKNLMEIKEQHQDNIEKTSNLVKQKGNESKNVIRNKPNNKSLNEIKKSASVDKKRKRVLHVSDSESEDEKNDPFVEENADIDMESEDEIPPTPVTNTVKITSGIVNPKKKRKIVDKTYTDEDGYILTKKEEVYESCSENDEDSHVKENVLVNKFGSNEVSPKTKTNGVKLNKKKVSSPQKGKQSTINSFFKKK